MSSSGCRFWLRALAAMAAVATTLAIAPPAAPQGGRQPLDIRVFARVGSPGQPEAIAVGTDGTVYVGTNQQERGDTSAPSRVFAYSAGGTLLRDYEIAGQKLDEPHGIQGLAFDAEGLLYALDRAADARVLILDPRTGAQRDYAHFRDVPSCTVAGRSTDCSDTLGDMEAGPNTAAFGPDGSLYVTDIDQALIWRVPRGGGTPEVFFTDRRLENLFGPNGIQFMADGRTLLFAVTAQSPVAGNPTEGRLFALPIEPEGKPGELREVYRSRPFDGPDGFAIGRSGNIYLALAGASQLVVVSPTGQELARVPDPFTNQQLDPPFDGPASVAFLGQSVLVTNQSYPAGNPDHWVVFDVFTGEAGLPLFRPRMTGVVAPSLSLRLASRSGRTGGGRRCARGPVLATVRGSDSDEVSQARFLLDGRQVAIDRDAPFSATVYRPRPGPSRRRTVRVAVALEDGRNATLTKRLRTCAQSAGGPRFTG